MALRIANKINRQFLTNVVRTLSAKRDVPELEVTARNDGAKNQDAVPPPQGGVQYQVCQPRARNVGSLANRGSAHNEADVVKNHMAMQHLQPALLPEYFKPPVEINSCMYPDAITETEKQSSIKKASRRFEDSMTRMNLTLPLKAPKLANPFPEPVKVMESCTISDQEKAELMLAEQKAGSRTSGSMSDHQQASRRNPGAQSIQATQRRYYSTNKDDKKEKKCKLGTMDEDPKKAKCKHMKVPFCADSTGPSCATKFMGYPPCKKKLAPYASYSEMCPDEPYRKPSECKMCPWKPDEHPSFKPPKKKFHTNTPTGFSSKKKDECCKVTYIQKEPCAWVKLDKEKEEQAKNKKGISNSKPKKRAARIFYPTMTSLAAGQPNGKYAKKKKPCQNQPCCDNPIEKRQQEVKPPKKGKTPPKQKSSGVSLGQEIGVWLQQVRNKKTPLQEAAEASKVLQQETLTPTKPCKGMSLKDNDRCTKFPFKQMSFPLVKERPVRPKRKPGTCPKKPLPKLIKDCPAEKEKDDRACDGVSYDSIDDPAASVLNGGSFGYLMGGAGGSGKKDDKCPKIEIGICSTLPDKNEPDVDQCGRGPKPKSWKCPDDLLKTHTPGYRKPRKKSCPVLPHIPNVAPPSEHHTGLSP